MINLAVDDIRRTLDILNESNEISRERMIWDAAVKAAIRAEGNPIGAFKQEAGPEYDYLMIIFENDNTPKERATLDFISFLEINDIGYHTGGQYEEDERYIIKIDEIVKDAVRGRLVLDAFADKLDEFNIEATYGNLEEHTKETQANTERDDFEYARFQAEDEACHEIKSYLREFGPVDELYDDEDAYNYKEPILVIKDQPYIDYLKSENIGEQSVEGYTLSFMDIVGKDNYGAYVEYENMIEIRNTASGAYEGYLQRYYEIDAEQINTD